MTRWIRILGVLACLGLCCVAALAQQQKQEAWVKYRYVKPAFSIELPSGWTVSTEEKVTDMSMGTLKLKGQVKVSFATDTALGRATCSVTVYALPNDTTGTKLQGTLETLVPVVSGSTLKMLKGQFYLRVDQSPGRRGGGKAIWRSYLFGEKYVYCIALDMPNGLQWQYPCVPIYTAMVDRFTAGDWPLKMDGTPPPPDPVLISIVNTGNQPMYISLTQLGLKSERMVNPGQTWDVSLLRADCAGYWGFFANKKIVEGTAIDTALDKIADQETWYFKEGPSPRSAKVTIWVRQKVKLPTAAEALGSWLKYVQADPPCTLDFPGGWTIVGGDKTGNITSGAVTLSPKATVGFEFGTAPTQLRTNVVVYSASDTVDMKTLQGMESAFPVIGSATPRWTAKQVNKLDYLLGEYTVNSQSTYSSYLPAGDTVYQIAMQGPSSLAAPGTIAYQHMLESFLAASWPPKPAAPKPVFPAATTTTPATPTTPAAPATPTDPAKTAPPATATQPANTLPNINGF